MTKKEVEKPKTSAFSVKNYLTLVILLIVLICFSLGIALGLGAPSLSSPQKWVLIATMIIFPFLSVSIVTWLIIRHSKKLAIADNDEDIHWETASSEKQKRKLNTEVRELAKTLEISTEQLSDLRSAYIVAEDLALRKIQEEADVPLMRKLNIGNADFDGICIQDDLVTCIEVTFLVSPQISANKINMFLRKAASAKTVLQQKRKGSKIRLLLVLVTQLDDEGEAKLRSTIKENFKPDSTPVDVDIRFLDFQTLQKVYAED